MDKTFAQLIGEGGLPTEIVKQLEEAFEARVAEKVNEAREEAELTVREQLAERYEADKNVLIESLDKIITEAVNKYETEKAQEVAALREAQEKFHNGLVEAKANYKSKLKEHLNNTNDFVAQHLAEEVKNMRKERKALAEARAVAAREVSEIKDKLTEAHNIHVQKIDEFVVAQVTNEIKEFDQDRRALVETRAKLIMESRQKLADTQKRFVKESADKLDSFVSRQVANEMTQLHEDLERNRQNELGRRVFEAIQAEFQASYYSDGTEAKKLQVQLDEAKQELATAKNQINENAKVAAQAANKVRLAEDKAQRAQIMAEILAPLSGSKKSLMEGLLDTVKTPDLRKSFERLLPVLETKKPQTAKVLNESPTQRRVVTGDKQGNRLVETINQTETDNELIAQVVRLAGIKK